MSAESQVPEVIPPRFDLEQETIASEAMLLDLHAPRKQGRGSYLICRSAGDDDGRYVEGALEPFYMHAGELTHVYKLDVEELGTADATRRVVGQLWFTPQMYDKEGRRSKVVIGKNDFADGEGQALVAEFLSIARGAYEKEQQLQQEAVVPARPTRFRRFAGRVATFAHLRPTA